MKELMEVVFLCFLSSGHCDFKVHISRVSPNTVCPRFFFFFLVTEAFLMISPQTAKGKVVTSVSDFLSFLQAPT